MDKPSLYKKLFLFGGIYNLCISLPIWLFGIVDKVTASTLFGMGVPPTLIFFTAMMWFVFAFGIGYIIVSRDITKNHGVVVIGAMEKIAFFIDAVAVFALGEVAVTVVVLGTVDLVFGIIFIQFLLWAKKQPK
jgi:hypothetical protein